MKPPWLYALRYRIKRRIPFYYPVTSFLRVVWLKRSKDSRQRLREAAYFHQHNVAVAERYSR